VTANMKVQVLQELQNLVVQSEGENCVISKDLLRSVVSKIEGRLSDLETSLHNLLIDHSGESRTLSLVAAGGISIPISIDRAVAASEYFQRALSSGMQEESNSKIMMEHVDVELLAIIGSFVKLGSLCNEMVYVKKMESCRAYQLIELCTQMFLTSACLNLAGRIEEITDLDATFLVLANRQRETCNTECMEAWDLACTKAIQY
jgi:hypothetical protein